jgi:hypothetical protein
MWKVTPLEETGTPLGVGVEGGAAAVRACVVPATIVSMLFWSDGTVVAGTLMPQAKTVSPRSAVRRRVFFMAGS